MGVADEVAEQPAVLARLLADGHRDVVRIADAVTGTFDSVVVAARGSSDHAAIYAQYLFGVALGLPVGLATPSVITRYETQIRFRRTLVVGISQSGESPDVAAVLDNAKNQRCPTIAITNAPGSPLASAADHVIDLRAGPERAVAATKTFTASLLAVAMVNAALGGRPRLDDLQRVPDLASIALEDSGGRAAAEALSPFERLIVVGRGFALALAREWALKMQELAQVAALAYSTADALHGPIAMLGPGDGACAVAFDGPVIAETTAFVDGFRHRQGREAVVITDAAHSTIPGLVLQVPPCPHEALAPIVGAIPVQAIAIELARVKGLDPDRPTAIEKVTRTL